MLARSGGDKVTRASPGSDDERVAKRDSWSLSACRRRSMLTLEKSVKRSETGVPEVALQYASIDSSVVRSRRTSALRSCSYVRPSARRPIERRRAWSVNVTAPSDGAPLSWNRRHTSTYTSWSNVPGRRSPGVGRTRHRPPDSGAWTTGPESEESLKRNSGRDSRLRSSSTMRDGARRALASSTGGVVESGPSMALPESDDLTSDRSSGTRTEPQDPSRNGFPFDVLVLLAHGGEVLASSNCLRGKCV